MAECAIARCVQERRSFKKELQKWGKNVLFLVGLERVAEELVGREKWKRLSAPINELENQLVTDWEPENICCFCNNTKQFLQVSDPSKGICSLDSLSNYNNGADSDGQMSEVFKIKVRPSDTIGKRDSGIVEHDNVKRKTADNKNHRMGITVNNMKISSDAVAEEKMEVIDLTSDIQNTLPSNPVVDLTSVIEVDSAKTKSTENWNALWERKYMLLRDNSKIVCLLCGSYLLFDEQLFYDHMKQKHTTFICMSSINKRELYRKLCFEYEIKRKRKEKKQQLRIFDYFKLNQNTTAKQHDNCGGKSKKLRI